MEIRLGVEGGEGELLSPFIVEKVLMLNLMMSFEEFRGDTKGIGCETLGRHSPSTKIPLTLKGHHNFFCDGTLVDNTLCRVSLALWFRIVRMYVNLMGFELRVVL